MALQSLDIWRRSATTTEPPQQRVAMEVAKLIDVTKCIGCKACQSACQEWNDLREGDLVFFNTMGAGVSHVGMVMNAGSLRFIHASSSHGVIQADLNKNYYKARYLGARRIIP